MAGLPVDIADGYLDDVFDIFDKHEHPAVLVEQCALMWMGVSVNPTDYDFLVRDAQLQPILTTFLASGEWRQVEQDLSSRYNDPYVKPVPRLRRTVREPIHISLWSEKLYFLPVDADGRVQVPNIVSWNSVLMQEDFDPGQGYPDLTKSRLEQRGTRIVPKYLAQKLNRSPIYIPTILQMVEALLQQDRYRQEHAQKFEVLDNRPAEHLTGLIRALFLDKQHQRDKLLPCVSDQNLSLLEAKLARFKRRRTVVVDSLDGVAGPPRRPSLVSYDR